MALDKNARHFWLTVTEIEANVIPDNSDGYDVITIEFAGKVTPSIRERFQKALDNGYYTLEEKKLV